MGRAVTMYVVVSPGGEGILVMWKRKNVATKIVFTAHAKEGTVPVSKDGKALNVTNGSTHAKVLAFTELVVWLEIVFVRMDGPGIHVILR